MPPIQGKIVRMVSLDCDLEEGADLTEFCRPHAKHTNWRNNGDSFGGSVVVSTILYEHRLLSIQLREDVKI